MYIMFVGVKRFSYDISMMAGGEPNLFWKASWKFITPALLLVKCISYLFFGADPEGTDLNF